MNEDPARHPLAALAMYDWPEVAWANDTLWDFLRNGLVGRGIDAPMGLSRDQPYFGPWRSPDLLLAQTCGYPFATELQGLVQLVATPCYSVDGCNGPNYCSMIVANRTNGPSSLADAGDWTAAINSGHSQSGHWALRAAFASEPGAVSPRRAVLSGGHRESLAMVAAGAADIAAIDAVCWALALRHYAGTCARVRVIARSPMAPGLPLIAALATPERTILALRAGLEAAMTESRLAQARAALFLSGVEFLPPAAYQRILDLRTIALGVPFPLIGD